ncbi:MAG: thiamine pyrophosphate-binding protein [Chloroflexota bacterium]
MAKMTGGDLVVETLKAAGVEAVFGILSVHNIPIYDAIGRRGGIRPVPVRHEQSAVLAADGYYRATGKLGVAITSTGPGAGNAMGSMVESQWGASAVLHIAGQVESHLIGKMHGFGHEAKDQYGMLQACSKWVGRPTDTANIPAVVAEAISQALSGHRGPVSIDMPIDLQYASAEAPIPTAQPEPARTPDASLVRRAAEILGSARRPLIWAGGGVVSGEATAEVRALAERLGAGVITSITGRGSIPEDHTLSLGVLTGEQSVQALLEEADVLLAIGTRFHGGMTQNWTLKVPPTLIHVDVDPDVLNRIYPSTVGILGDAKLALAGIAAALTNGAATEAGWSGRVAAARDEARAAVRQRIGHYARFVDDLRDLVPREATIVKDTTIQANAWANRILDVLEPRTTVNAASGAIGVSLPMAIGAAVGRPGEPVICITGDGGFSYNVPELATAVQERLPVIVLVFNDGGYGVLRNIQDLRFEGRRMGSVDLHMPDYVRVAEAYGLWSRKVSSIEEFGRTVGQALNTGGPALIEIDLKAIGEMPVKFPAAMTPSPRR